jgi:hypothetical protein
MRKLTKALIAAGLLTGQMGVLHAAVTADEAKQLGTTLTLVGAEKAGNKEGTIPEYAGGLTAAPAGYDKASGVRPDPYASEKPVISIDAKNMDKYADKLTEGTKALMKANADFRIDVYPTHRTVAYPKFVLDNTVKNATRAKLSADGLSQQGAIAGIPFPIPKNGSEVMLDYIARYQGVSNVVPKYTAYNVDRAGKLVLSSQGTYTQEFPYYAANDHESPVQSRVKANYTGPARRAGEASIVIDPVDYSTKDRRAWSYVAAQRRVRLAPDLAYDTPNGSTSGMSTYDDTNLFNGKQDRFDFKLVGKKELYVPYNTYRFTYYDKPEDLFKAKFINPDLVRWELHRVWVVEATLKEGQRHIYSRRTFYVDEDSWVILASDQYDGRGQLWRPGFNYLTYNYDAQTINAVAGHYDVIGGTYYVNIWPGAGGLKQRDAMEPDTAWTPDALAQQGVR